jgi:hypothetical protein
MHGSSRSSSSSSSSDTQVTHATQASATRRPMTPAVSEEVCAAMARVTTPTTTMVRNVTAMLNTSFHNWRITFGGSRPLREYRFYPVRVDDVCVVCINGVDQCVKRVYSLQICREHVRLFFPPAHDLLQGLGVFSGSPVPSRDLGYGEYIQVCYEIFGDEFPAVVCERVVEHNISACIGTVMHILVWYNLVTQAHVHGMHDLLPLLHEVKGSYAGMQGVLQTMQKRLETRRQAARSRHRTDILIEA